MNLILLYGAPGTGKYTIAKDLQELTKYTLLHNHLILNALSEIFGFDNPIRRKLEKEFRYRMIEEMVHGEMNIIITGVIMRDNELFYRKVIDLVEKNNGKCFLVQLTASPEALQKRIGSASRKAMKKIVTAERLQEWSEKYPESHEKIDYKNQFTLDTSALTPQESAQQIASWLHTNK